MELGCYFVVLWVDGLVWYKFWVGGFDVIGGFGWVGLGGVEFGWGGFWFVVVGLGFVGWFVGWFGVIFWVLSWGFVLWFKI